MTPEGKVKQAVTRILKAHDVYYFYPATGGYGRSGVPDIVCCVDGCFLGIECKAEGGKLTALQEHELQKIANAKGRAFIARPSTIDFLNTYITSLRKNTHAG